MQKEKDSIKFSALIEIAEDDREVYEALRIEEKEYPRSVIRVKKANRKTIIEIEAKDKSAFFASVNSVLTLIRALPMEE